ncbi:hypothetical protein FEFB_11030 [Fructobacillus sp. EFB-N1]|uniref:hypothetical protein n=1 Tax=Fructobacillus sp. EFB-N1 TaxID=1658766 RepID=UPI00064DBB85|nr:hypothetical protein [Fructobacillus sp. EFB-N1]KMK53175.1 hypothetical protein FEFB_11030 [Fructobacillus sp. EFB-N1]
MILIGLIAIFIISIWFTWKSLTVFLPWLIIIWVIVSILSFIFSWVFIMFASFALSGYCFYLAIKKIKEQKSNGRVDITDESKVSDSDHK